MPIRKEIVSGTKFIVFSKGVDLLAVHSEQQGVVKIDTTGLGVLTSTQQLEELGRDLLTINESITADQ